MANENQTMHFEISILDADKNVVVFCGEKQQFIIETDYKGIKYGFNTNDYAAWLEYDTPKGEHVCESFIENEGETLHIVCFDTLSQPA